MPTNEIETDFTPQDAVIIAIITIAVLSQRLATATGGSQQKEQALAASEARQILETYSPEKLRAFMQQNFSSEHFN
jgi:hypothetical protein